MPRTEDRYLPSKIMESWPMKALFFDGRLSLREDFPMCVVPPGETLVRVRRAGICQTDIEISKGYMSFRGILGHEFVGQLEDGSRVVGEINAADGTCDTCRAGLANHCRNRSVLGIVRRDGAMADYLTLPARNLHRVPDAVSDAQAVFVEPLAAALEITDRVHIRPSAHVLVIGDGKLGLLIAQVLQLTGCDLSVLGRHAHKLAMLQRRGITTITESSHTLGWFDVVVECSGNASGFDLARRLLRPRGTLVLKSTLHGVQELALAPVVIDEISIVGSRCGPFAPALRLLAEHLIDVEPLLEAEYPLERAAEAFQRAMTPGTLKVQLVMSA
jgi:threonine dehydrogenase-like Zn-dependent dehydrogenase